MSIYGKNFKCVTQPCTELKCKFEFNSDDSIIFQAKFISSNEIKCKIPQVNKPQTVNIKVTIDDRDYSNNVVKFIYFDPFVVNFNPSIIPVKGFSFLFIN